MLFDAPAMRGGRVPRWVTTFLCLSVFIATIADARPAVGDTACVDINNANPPALRYGMPAWRTLDHPNCKPRHRLDPSGRCYNSLSRANNCNAFCRQASGWYYGQPIDLMKGQICEVGDPCRRNFDYSRSLSSDETDTFQNKTSHSESNLSKKSTSFSLGHSFSSSYDRGWNAAIRFKPTGEPLKEFHREQKQKLQKPVDKFADIPRPLPKDHLTELEPIPIEEQQSIFDKPDPFGTAAKDSRINSDAATAGSSKPPSLGSVASGPEAAAAPNEEGVITIDEGPPGNHANAGASLTEAALASALESLPPQPDSPSEVPPDFVPGGGPSDPSRPDSPPPNFDDLFDLPRLDSLPEITPEFAPGGRIPGGRPDDFSSDDDGSFHTVDEYHSEDTDDELARTGSHLLSPDGTIVGMVGNIPQGVPDPAPALQQSSDDSPVGFAPVVTEPAPNVAPGSQGSPSRPGSVASDTTVQGGPLPNDDIPGNNAHDGAVDPAPKSPVSRPGSPAGAPFAPPTGSDSGSYPVTPERVSHPGAPKAGSRPGTPVADERRPFTPKEVSHPSAPKEVSHPSTPKEVSHPSTPKEGSHHGTPKEGSRPGTPDERRPSDSKEVGRPGTPKEGSRPITPVADERRPSTPEGSHPGTPEEGNRPGTPVSNERRPSTPKEVGHPGSPVADERRPSTPKVGSRPGTPVADERRPSTPKEGEVIETMWEAPADIWLHPARSSENGEPKPNSRTTSKGEVTNPYRENRWKPTLSAIYEEPELEDMERPIKEKDNSTPKLPTIPEEPGSEKPSRSGTSSNTGSISSLVDSDSDFDTILDQDFKLNGTFVRSNSEKNKSSQRPAHKKKTAVSPPRRDLEDADDGISPEKVKKPKMAANAKPRLKSYAQLIYEEEVRKREREQAAKKNEKGTKKNAEEFQKKYEEVKKFWDGPKSGGSSPKGGSGSSSPSSGSSSGHESSSSNNGASSFGKRPNKGSNHITWHPDDQLARSAGPMDIRPLPQLPESKARKWISRAKTRLRETLPHWGEQGDPRSSALDPPAEGPYFVPITANWFDRKDRLKDEDIPLRDVMLQGNRAVYAPSNVSRLAAFFGGSRKFLLGPTSGPGSHLQARGAFPANPAADAFMGALGKAVGKALGISVEASTTFSANNHYADSVDLNSSTRKDFSVNAAKEQSYGSTKNVQYRVSISEGQGWSKPNYAASYCGSWFAVPIMGVDCGRAAIGHLNVNGSQCTVDAAKAESNFDQCFDYTFRDPSRPEASRYKQVFVLRDCAEGFILPGEWQHPVFANSFGIKAFATNHVRRFGMTNNHRGRGTLDQTSWNYEDEKHAFTRTIGPANHTIEVCGRGKYCARHKLEDRKCYSFPRGYSGVKSVHIVSAKTAPGQCCVLFSKPECYGLPQVVKGAIDNLSTVGYEGIAHSVMCNVNEYCNPDIMDAFLE